MSTLGFHDLSRLPVVRYYETAFHRATGVSLKVIPPEAPATGPGPVCAEAGFCSVVGCTPAGCALCRETGARVLESVARKLAPQQTHCYAGLTVSAVPVIAGGRHLATLISGQVFRRDPTERDFLIVVKMLGAPFEADWVRKARKAYFETPVLTLDRFQAVLQLLYVFAQFLADSGSRQAMATAPSEPKAVASAKLYVESHVDQAITLEEVVQHVHVSRFYFCKLFKKATGITLTEYVARARVEKAKSLLADHSLRISEVVFAAGFGSIPQFNSVFKRFAGMPPTEYRATLRSPLAL
jgi:AraC-like DNA-binding protein